MFQIVDGVSDRANIRVIGVGGGGCNAVAHMIESAVEGVDFICVNTDAQALRRIQGATLLQIGGTTAKGLGAGADPGVGEKAALEDRDRLAEALEGADMLFIAAGMGGGTGTGAAPIIAEVAKELNILTIAVVTRPFLFEGKKRMAVAEGGVCRLKEHVDSIITVPNEKLLAVLGKNTSLIAAFKAANDVLLGSVQGIADLIVRPGLINLDFADVRAVMAEMGMAMMGTGRAAGDDRARIAAEAAVRNSLLEDVDLRGARGILVNVTAGLDLTLGEYTEIGDIVGALAADDAKVVVGTTLDPDIGEQLRVTVVTTGLGQGREVAAVPTPARGRAADPMPDYRELSSRPAIVRRNGYNADSRNGYRAEGSAARKVDISSDKHQEYLDIPAFLRRQVD